MKVRYYSYSGVGKNNEAIKAKCYELKCKMGASVALVFIERD